MNLPVTQETADPVRRPGRRRTDALRYRVRRPDPPLLIGTWGPRGAALLGSAVLPLLRRTPPAGPAGDEADRQGVSR